MISEGPDVSGQDAQKDRTVLFVVFVVDHMESMQHHYFARIPYHIIVLSTRLKVSIFNDI